MSQYFCAALPRMATTELTIKKNYHGQNHLSLTFPRCRRISQENIELDYLDRHIFYNTRPLLFYRNPTVLLKFVLCASYNSDRENENYYPEELIFILSFSVTWTETTSPTNNMPFYSVCLGATIVVLMTTRYSGRPWWYGGLERRSNFRLQQANFRRILID